MSENSAAMFSMLSERGFKLLVFGGFKFSKSRKTVGGQKWRCTNRKCPAHLFTDDGGEELLKAVGEHTHGPCANIHRHCISNSVKRKAADTVTEPPAKVIKKEIVSVPETISGKVTTGDLDRIRRNLSYAKRRTTSSRCIADVHDATTQGQIFTEENQAYRTLKEDEERRRTEHVEEEYQQVKKCLQEANERLDSLYENINQSTPNDACAVYGQIVADRLRQLNSQVRDTVQNKIDNLLFEAFMQDNLESTRTTTTHEPPQLEKVVIVENTETFPVKIEYE